MAPVFRPDRVSFQIMLLNEEFNEKPIRSVVHVTYSFSIFNVIYSFNNIFKQL